MYALSNKILTLRHLLIQRSKKASPWFQTLVTTGRKHMYKTEQLSFQVTWSKSCAWGMVCIAQTYVNNWQIEPREMQKNSV